MPPVTEKVAVQSGESAINCPFLNFYVLWAAGVWEQGKSSSVFKSPFIEHSVTIEN
jgi:hypothetical protein